MIFLQLRQSKMAQHPDLGPLQEHSDLVDDLLVKHTESDSSTLEEVRCVVRYPDGKSHQLDDSITRYSDKNLVLYNYDEKIDPEFFTISIHGKTPEGHTALHEIINELSRHPAYSGRVAGMMLQGVVTDEPHCIPCAKKNFKGGV